MTQNGDSAPRRSLACRLGIHRWYLDCAFFERADRCDRCGRYKRPYEGERLIREREAWSHVPDGVGMIEGAALVMAELHAPTNGRGEGADNA